MHDSHAHLVMSPLKETYTDWIKEFKEKGGKYILNVSYDLESAIDVIHQDIELENVFPGMILSGIGLHPEFISEIQGDRRKGLEKQLKELENIVMQHRKRIRAIGETGLDYYHISNDSSLTPDEREELIELQKLSFKRHIELACELNLPMSIHSRDIPESTKCTQDALKIVTQIGKGCVRGCFHSYVGAAQYLKEILNLGFFVGFNGIITYPKGENVRELLTQTPPERILTETDCPLLPPQKVRSGKNGKVKYGKPGDIEEIVETAARIKNTSVEKFLEITNTNFESLFLRN